MQATRVGRILSHCRTRKLEICITGCGWMVRSAWCCQERAWVNRIGVTDSLHSCLCVPPPYIPACVYPHLTFLLVCIPTLHSCLCVPPGPIPLCVLLSNALSHRCLTIALHVCMALTPNVSPQAQRVHVGARLKFDIRYGDSSATWPWPCSAAANNNLHIVDWPLFVPARSSGKNRLSRKCMPVLASGAAFFI